MAWRRPGAKPLSEPIIISLQTHIYDLNELRQWNCQWAPPIRTIFRTTQWLRNIVTEKFQRSNYVL